MDAIFLYLIQHILILLNKLFDIIQIKIFMQDFF